MATDIIKKFWDKLSRRHDNLGRDDSFYALFSNGFNKAKLKVDHITRVVVREYDEETLKKIEDGLVAIDTIVRNPKQFLKVDDEIRAAVNRNASSSELEKIAVKNGMTTLREDGLAKVAAKITTLEELDRSAAEM